MHKLMDYICKELEELERKAEKDSKLSMAEIEYADKLVHMKKNLLKSEELWDSSEFSMCYEGPSYTRRGGSGRRGGANQYGSYRTNDSYGMNDSYAMEGYSRAGKMVSELRNLMHEAPDDRTRTEFEHFIRKIEKM